MMSFNDKLNRLFDSLVLGRPDVPKYIEHIYADYIELNALFLKEEVTLSDISDKLQDIKDQNILETEEIDSIEEQMDEIASLEAERNDIIQEKFHSVFDLCKERKLLYGADEYPFHIEENYIRLKSELTVKHKIYLLLLICANLNHFKSIQHELTVDFETIALYSLKSLLPTKAIVKAFGKTSSYVGNAKTKLMSLAEELKVDINTKRIESISAQNSQERGLDLIGWLPFKDNIPNMLIILGQCACGKKWNEKHYDTLRFKEYFHFDKTPIHAMFVPYGMSKPKENKFCQHDELLSDHLFFDRKRILEQFDDLSFIGELQSFPIVERSISETIAV